MADLAGYSAGAQAPVTTNQAQAPSNDPAAATQLQQSLNTIPLTEEQVMAWWKEIEASEALINERARLWDTCLKAYMPMVTEGAENPKTNTHFRNVHTKIGQMFVKSPDVIFNPEGPAKDQIVVMQLDPTTGLPAPTPVTAEEAVAIKQTVVNKHMSAEPGMINGLRLMDECLFDCLTWAHIMCVKVGYMATMKSMRQPKMIPDPNAQAAMDGSVMGMFPPEPRMVQATQFNPATFQEEPVFETIQVPVHHCWYAKRISPKKILFNRDLTSTRFDEDARWIGHKSLIQKRIASRMFGIPEEQLPGGKKDESKADTGLTDAGEDTQDLVEVIELSYKAPFYTDEVHPQAINQLVLIRGMNQTVVSRPSPDQEFTPTGTLAPHSLLGFPIKIGTIRDLADSPLPLSDTAFTNSQVKFLDTHLSQSVKLRDAQIGKYFADSDAFEDEDIETLKNGEAGSVVWVKGGTMSQGADKIWVPTSKVQGSQDDYRTVGMVKQYMDETLGISSTQAGAPAGAVRSATEVRGFETNSEGRVKKERARVIEFYVSIVRAVDQLITRYADGAHYISVVGEDGARKIVQWSDKLLQNAPQYTYSIKTDSQLDLDVRTDRQQKMGFLNLVGQDPLFNRIPVLRDLARDFGYNPFEVIMPMALVGSQPPAGGPINKHEGEKSGETPNAPGSQGAGRGERNPGVSDGKGDKNNAMR